ncbi:PREDICTED: uncharacterized protein LOC104802086 isoform X2 [Tarenaya hassleriana]|uniref:uncharacterized protein LOC104802086 isoform X2 n=1 Tax=Tarenaya hassleriana TaxID=28532 RepID=UPI00053C34DB|nr:PREDICTED: uncharacterized protein LOC104802086 isoform X2 [Tarenaya hassleriana]
MKIFNWVQRKLHQNVIKDGVVKTVKKNEPSEIDKNTKAILDQVGLVEVLENWVDGVLTIGTFGFDTLKYSDDKEKYDSSENEEGEDVGDDDDDDDGSMDLDDDEFTKNSVIVYKDEELDPLISTTDGSHDNGDDLGFGIVGSELMRAVDCVDFTPGADVDFRGRKRRTTLAELFMEDGDTHFKKCLNPLEIESSYGKYKLDGSKLSRLSFAKKIASRAKDHDSRPIKKLHQMMKRMLKRKIHPDVDVGKTCKSDGLNKPIKKIEAAESIHLLNIPGPVV